MTDSYVVLWSRAFALTFVVEAALVVPLLRAFEPRLMRRISIALLVNIASHPAVWFVIPTFGLSYGPRLAVSEAWAVLLETWGYLLFFPAAAAVAKAPKTSRALEPPLRLTLRRAFALALGANALSVIVGLCLRALGVPL